MKVAPKKSVFGTVVFNLFHAARSSNIALFILPGKMAQNGGKHIILFLDPIHRTSLQQNRQFSPKENRRLFTACPLDCGGVPFRDIPEYAVHFCSRLGRVFFFFWDATLFPVLSNVFCFLAFWLAASFLSGFFSLPT